MAPDDMMTLYGTVSGGAATGYDDDWLVDGRIGRPAKTTTSTPPWVITGSGAKTVNAVVVANHNIDADKTIAITGGVSVNLTGPAARGNGIPVNPWALVQSPASTNTITVTINSNSVAIVIGEVLAGTMSDVDKGLLMGATTEYLAGGDRPYSHLSSLPGYDDGVAQRAISGTVIGPQATADALVSWWEATRADTRPSVLIPYEGLNDAWVGHLTNFRDQTVSGLWRLTFTFVESPRSRW